MEQKDFQRLEQKLDNITRLLAYEAIKGKKMPEGVPLLKSLGLSASEIAAVYNTSTKTISVRLAESKRPENQKTKPKAKTEKNKLPKKK